MSLTLPDAYDLENARKRAVAVVRRNLRRTAQESAMVFLEDEKVRLYILLDAIDSAGLVNFQHTREMILDRLHELEQS